VRGVGEERERARDDARGDLGEHEADDQRERDREAPPTGVADLRGMVVPVVVLVPDAVSVIG
jgi:hypothetical protein